jgi:transcriptional regulator with XRE-family HTH domain
MSLGKKIKELREEKRISIRELGRRTDVTGMHISNLEKGKVNASPELVSKIATTLDANMDELLHLANRVDPEVVDVIQKNPIAVPSFLRSAKDLSPEQWQKMQKYLDAMKKFKANKG